MKLIGKSLSCCVIDIAIGNVDYDDVIRVDTAASGVDLEASFACYMEDSWSDLPEALVIARRLKAQGKILAQRPGQHGDFNIGDGHWIIKSF